MEVMVIDSGCANLSSVVFAFERLGANVTTSRDGAEIARAPLVVLPGVGSARYAMENLQSLGLVDVIKSLTQPLLGICLGMQLLFDESAEGKTPCLGLMKGQIDKLPDGPCPVPHMGWNQLENLNSACPLVTGLDEGAYAYFVHSYYRAPRDETMAQCDYGPKVAAIVQRGNVFGCQFHPERSSDTGAQILKNLLQLGAS